jgi:hypothetical protein
VLAVLGIGLSVGLTGCGGTEHLVMSHRHSPGSEARIVVLPIALPPSVAEPERQGRSLASIYATELLRSYEVLEFDRFKRSLERRGLTLENVVDGDGVEVVGTLGVDGVLVSEVYSWEPGKPGFWFLAKGGRVGFVARLVDPETGSVIWSVNRVAETGPSETLALGLATVFRDLADEMPRTLTPY